ncbi:2-nitropropane dioxygenase [Virgibacillus profundi]|uniref:Probable nitronate monooxygenase n=1 Tax=Virgibacillus profundi TaxID=2024555 RepID=A0A2A2IJH9_9BACI|nr:nitronate monooxygenase [Virgibacillus profundi]PAV31476.1 2-nitropropane dioxygenase [Virgibacillus profundi]PXY55662.1 nitronate monooxygenase [Virgibacillus profundi]
MNSFLEKVKVDIPIIQAGMAGGITTPELVAAVANTGALGTVGAGYMSASTLKENIKQIKGLTNKDFAVNLFATNLETFSTDIQEMQIFLDKYRNELELDKGSKQVKVNDYLQEKIYVILQENIPIVSTAFGVLSSVLIEKLKKNDVTLIGMATNLDEAKQLVEAGYDIIVAQGFEAGGHRGTFDVGKYPNGSDIGLMVLAQSFVENLPTPVIAAGGIHSSGQIDALLSMGVAGVQLGTRFLMAKEAGTNNAYRRALIKADTEDTVIIKVFSGRPARAINNRFINEAETSQVDLLPFPIQNELTKDLRAAGSEFAISDFQSLWAGQGVGAIHKEETVREIMDSLVENSKEIN